MAPLVFISHASSDAWVAGQIAKEVAATGADVFLDSQALETGDEVDSELRNALDRATEVLVLLTPAALERPYVWVEIGVAWIRRTRIVGILHGMSRAELLARSEAPGFLKNLHLRDIGDLDEYLGELSRRVKDD